SGKNFALSELSLLDPAFASTWRGLEARTKRILTPPNEAKTKMYKEIACREFVSDIRDVKYDFDFVDGEFVLRDIRLCSGIPFDRPFDASSYQMKAPVYYFSGKRDPVTPPFQAEHHFHGQQTTAKNFVSV